MPRRLFDLLSHQRSAIGKKPVLMLDLDDSIWNVEELTPEEQQRQDKRFNVTFKSNLPRLLTLVAKAKTAGFDVLIFTMGMWPMDFFEACLAEAKRNVEAFRDIDLSTFDDTLYIERGFIVDDEQYIRQLASNEDGAKNLFDGDGVKGSAFKLLFNPSDNVLRYSILYDDSDEQRADAEKLGMKVVNPLCDDALMRLDCFIDTYTLARQSASSQQSAPTHPLLTGSNLPIVSRQHVAQAANPTAATTKMGPCRRQRLGEESPGNTVDSGRASTATLERSALTPGYSAGQLRSGNARAMLLQQQIASSVVPPNTAAAIPQQQPQSASEQRAEAIKRASLKRL